MTEQHKNLCAYSIPLYGKHLIEASAGTGKTYNITRIYLRLLLERRLTVEQILVMTFTNDATEELRGRIDASIREAINHWHTLTQEDEYFIALAKKISEAEAILLLKTALLYLDQAAIFTIHGFCKRVLTQHAFATGVTFNAHMETNCQELTLEACQDFYRTLSKKSAEQYQLLAQFWQTPASFVSQFSRAINVDANLQVMSAQTVIESFNLQVKQAKADLFAHKDFLFTHLVEVKKGAERQQREIEFEQLINFLDDLVDDIQLATQKMPTEFFNGRRFSRSAHKAQLIEIFSGVNALKTDITKIIEKIAKAQAYSIVNQGILIIRENVKAKKTQQNMLSFDDLITTLAQALTQYDFSSELAARLLAQFPVALVDEFQDTDPQQFAILQALYFPKNSNNNLESTGSALYLIGDPKQAIYGFRGGDVFAYLAARKACQYHWAMDTNWRSSPSMISAYNRLFWGNKLTENTRPVFGYDIPYSQVNPSVKGQQLAVIDTTYQALQFIHFNVSEYLDKKGEMAQSFRPIMATWCATEISRLLNITDMAKTKGVIAKDIAILVRDGSEAAEIKIALSHAGLSAVYLSERENLFATEQASQLLTVLRGILFVENERFFSAALANPLLALTPYDFYQLQQDQHRWQDLKFSFADLRKQWQQKSFISMALALLHGYINVNDDDILNSKDRILTNLLHLFEALQSASQRHQQGQELLFWFEQQIEATDPEGETELRLESDEDLIKIVTQHGSKGLEYPVVFIPFATRHKDPLKFGNKSVSLLNYHDEQGNLQLSLDGAKSAKDAMRDEAYAETIRLLYVAITRAKQRCYILSAPFKEAHNSPLGLTLKWQENTDIAQFLQQLALENSSNIGVELITEVLPNKNLLSEHSIKNQVPHDEKTQYQQAQFIGKIERDWWLSSFSALKKNLRGSGVSAPDHDNELTINANGVVNSQLLRFRLAKGAHTGNLLHNIFEHCDFTQPNWSEHLSKPLSLYSDLAEEDKPALITWLDDVLQTSLLVNDEQVNIKQSDHKESINELCLAKLAWSATLRESEFYFPMHKAVASTLTQLLTQHRQDKRVQKFAQDIPLNSVQLPHYQKLNGMMHGFIDLIFYHQGKYYVCDYKSTHLGDKFSDYTAISLLEDIEKNHYDLQYLIYSLALHRYLQQRLPNYDATTHFGGVYYLYLRGMSTDNDATNTIKNNQLNTNSTGVYYQAINAQLLQQLDQLFLGDLHEC